MPKVSFILNREHANELNLQLDQVAILKVNVVDYLHVDVLVLIYQLRVEVPEEHDVPVHNDLSCVRLIFVLEWCQLKR